MPKTGGVEAPAVNLLILYIFPRILRICSYINLNTIDFSFLTRNPKTFSFLFGIFPGSVFVIAMPLNTLPRLSQIYDNSRLFSFVSKTAVLFLYCTSVSRYSLFMELLR